MNYFVLGDEDTVLGFSLVGVNGLVVSEESEIGELFDRVLANEEIGIIIITERVANRIREKVESLQFRGEFPLVVEIPDRTGYEKEKPPLRDLINRVIGIRL